MQLVSLLISELSRRTPESVSNMNTHPAGYIITAWRMRGLHGSRVFDGWGSVEDGQL